MPRLPGYEARSSDEAKSELLAHNTKSLALGQLLLVATLHTTCGGGLGVS